MDTFVFPNFGTNVLGIDNKRNDHKKAYILPAMCNTPDIPYILNGCII